MRNYRYSLLLVTLCVSSFAHGYGVWEDLAVDADAPRTITLGEALAPWQLEVVFTDLKPIDRLSIEGQWPQLVSFTDGSSKVALSVNGSNNARDLFLSGAQNATQAGTTIGTVGSNNDVGNNERWAPTNGVMTIRLENNSKYLSVYQNGHLFIRTDKNTNEGLVTSVTLGHGLAALGGGRIASARIRRRIAYPSTYGQLVLDEEFNGTNINWNTWGKVPVPTPEKMCDWVQYTSHREDLTTVHDGCLDLMGAKNDMSDPTDQRKYLCGQLQTMDKFNFTYGVVEIRAKFSNQSGAWPAIWMLPQDKAYGEWPRSGEIDITERLNSDSFVYQTVHRGTNDGYFDQKQGKGAIDPNDFNVYRLEWTPSRITWYANGQATLSYDNQWKGWNQWPFDKNFYLVLSQQLEGSWVGTVKDESTLPNHMLVDYVRVWQQNPSDIRDNAHVWLDATDPESVVTNRDGEVERWFSKNAAGSKAWKYANDEIAPKGPIYKDGVVSFGDTSANRDLAFDRQGDFQSVFMVVKMKQNPNAFLLTDWKEYCFHRGANGELFHDYHASECLRDSNGVYWNGARVEDPTTWKMPEEWGLIECHTTSGVVADRFCCDRLETNRRGGKDVKEMLLFRQSLTEEEIRSIRKYLLEKHNIPHEAVDPIPEAPCTLDAPLKTGVDCVDLTVSAAVNLPAGKSGNIFDLPCNSGSRNISIWLYAKANAAGNFEIYLGYNADGKSTSYALATTLKPGMHQFCYCTSNNGSTLYVDGERTQDLSELKFRNNSFTAVKIGYKGAGLYAYDILPNYVMQVRYPRHATYPELNAIEIGQENDPLWYASIFWPENPSAMTLTARVTMPETFSQGTIASVGAVQNGQTGFAYVHRTSDTLTRIAHQNPSSSTQGYTEQTTTSMDNTGTKILNFSYSNTAGTDVALSGKAVVSAPKTVWSDSKVTEVSLGLKPGMIITDRRLVLNARNRADPSDPMTGLGPTPAWFPSASSAVQDYFRDIVVLSGGTYVPPPVTMDGKTLTDGESARIIYLHGGNPLESRDYTMVLDAPLVEEDCVWVGLRSDEPVNATLRLESSTDLTDWQVAAEMPGRGRSPSAPQERYFVTGRSTSPSTSTSTSTFYRLSASETAMPNAVEGMPLVPSESTRAYLGTISINSETLTLQLKGAGVAPGMCGYLIVDDIAYVAHVNDDHQLVFNLPTTTTSNDNSISASLYLVVPKDAANGDISLTQPTTTTSNYNYPQTLVTTIVADTLAKDGFSALTEVGGYPFGAYRIPSLVTDGAGEVLCCYDVRYCEDARNDLGMNAGIDIGETYSVDGGATFAKPHLAVDVVNYRDEKNVVHGFAKDRDIGDVSMLYDPGTETYWMMGITGKGLAGQDYSMNDVVLYRRGKGADAKWTSRRSIKDMIIYQPGVKGKALNDGCGLGFFQGPGHGFVTEIGSATMPKGTLVFPTQYFVDSMTSVHKSTAGAIYSLDHGENWTSTYRTTEGTSPQENCIVELDDGSWYMMAKGGGATLFSFFRTTDYKNWNYITYHDGVPSEQGSCLRLGYHADGTGRYVLCHTLSADTSRRARISLVFGRDTTREGGAISWDFANPVVIYADDTLGYGYNSLCKIDADTIGILYEARGKIYFLRYDIASRLGKIRH